MEGALSLTRSLQILICRMEQIKEYRRRWERYAEFGLLKIPGPACAVGRLIRERKTVSSGAMIRTRP